jgi:AraC-like DNA-binding protein
MLYEYERRRLEKTTPFVALSAALWHPPAVSRPMRPTETSSGDVWSGMALTARLQVAAGQLLFDRKASASAVLLEIAESIGRIDWPSVRVLEFIVARSVVVRFLCEVANRQPCALMPAALVTELEAASSEHFNATVVSAIRRLNQSHPVTTQMDEVDERVRIVLTLIRSHCERRIRIDELARAVGVSRWHLERLTKRDTGTTPGRHLAAARMERAIALLAQPRLSIKEVSSRVGYGNANGFARDFRKHYGSSPRTWRRMN